MTRLTKVCGLSGVACLVVGMLITFDVLRVGSQVGWYVTLPTGAVLLGVAIICYALENEMARFDAEQEAHGHEGNAAEEETVARGDAGSGTGLVSGSGSGPDSDSGCSCQPAADGRSLT